MLLGILFRWLLNALALWLTSILVPGIRADTIAATLIAAVVLGILNALLRPILIILTLPINVLTLGLFTFVINGLMLELTSRLVEGFHVGGFFAAFFGAIILSIVSVVLSMLTADPGAPRIHVEVRRG